MDQIITQNGQIFTFIYKWLCSSALLDSMHTKERQHCAFY